MERKEYWDSCRPGLISISSAISALSLDSLHEASINVEKLSGGLTNENVLVTLRNDDKIVDTRQLVLRRFLTKTSSYLNYDRQQEYLNTCIAAVQKKVGAPVIGFVPPTDEQGGALALEFVKGKTMDDTSILALCSSEVGLTRLVESLRKIHSGPPLFSNTFEPFQARVNFEEKVRLLSGKGVEWEGYDKLVEQLSCVQEHLAKKPEETVDCHNDLLSANFIDSDLDITIIDWELSGQAEPSWELGNFISENGLDDNDAVITSLVCRYWDSTSSWYDPCTKVKRAKLFSLVSKITWSAWGAVLHHLDKQDEFDYQEWSLQRLEKARVLLCDQDKLSALLQ